MGKKISMIVDGTIKYDSSAKIVLPDSVKIMGVGKEKSVLKRVFKGLFSGSSSQIRRYCFNPVKEEDREDLKKYVQDLTGLDASDISYTDFEYEESYLELPFENIEICQKGLYKCFNQIFRIDAEERRNEEVWVFCDYKDFKNFQK